ncbi:hypothetical protein KPC190_00734 [Klebsiella pneumoniae]|nr:hypothetical protein [Klebsiella pneumoniae]MCB8863359.1 hypothetical protein [Klebsiella pneumoniae]
MLKFMLLQRKKTRQWSSFVMRWRWSISLRLFPHAYRNLAAPAKSGTWLFFRLVHSFAQLVQMTDSRVHDHIALLLMKFTSIKAIRLLK